MQREKLMQEKSFWPEVTREKHFLLQGGDGASPWQPPRGGVFSVKRMPFLGARGGGRGSLGRRDSFVQSRWRFGPLRRVIPAINCCEISRISGAVVESKDQLQAGLSGQSHWWDRARF